MSEKLIKLSNIDLIKLFGSNNSKLDKIKKLFPQVKMIVRGECIKLIGSSAHVSLVEEKLISFQKHLDQYNSLTINQMFLKRN